MTRYTMKARVLPERRRARGRRAAVFDSFSASLGLLLR